MHVAFVCLFAHSGGGGRITKDERKALCYPFFTSFDVEMMKRCWILWTQFCFICSCTLTWNCWLFFFTFPFALCIIKCNLLPLICLFSFFSFFLSSALPMIINNKKLNKFIILIFLFRFQQTTIFTRISKNSLEMESFSISCLHRFVTTFKELFVFLLKAFLLERERERVEISLTFIYSNV